MDFVLESGSGDVDEQADPEALAFADSTAVTDNETPSFPRANLPEAEPDLGLPRARSRLRPCPGKRSWPLRDPEEAHLLRHFVDHIACFVSGGLANYSPEQL